jgi:hypothetical protein
MIKDDKFYSHNGILIGNGDRILGKYNTQYEVTVTTDGNGTAVANPNKGLVGTTVSLSNTPNYHYAFDHYTINGNVTTNNTFKLYSDTNVVAYFTRTAGYNDWYYDNDTSTSKVQNRSLTTDGAMIVAHQIFTASTDPTQDQRQPWSNYGVCRLKFTGNTSPDATTIARRSKIDLLVDAMTQLSHEDSIRFMPHDYYGNNATFTNVKFAFVIDFNNRTAKLYINDSVHSTYNLTMQCNGCFLAITNRESGYEPLNLTEISMKIFEEESDALAFARFQ